MNENTAVQRLYRSRTDRVFAGICGGLSERYGMDANVVRVILAVLTLIGVGTPLLAYLVCWLLIPENPR